MKKLFTKINQSIVDFTTTALTFLCLGVVIQLLLGGEILGWDPVGNIQNAEGIHRLNNFFDKNAVRVVENDGTTFFESNKSTSVHERMGYLGFVFDAGFAINDVRSGVLNKDSILKTLDVCNK